MYNKPKPHNNHNHNNHNNILHTQIMANRYVDSNESLLDWLQARLEAIKHMPAELQDHALAECEQVCASCAKPGPLGKVCTVFLAGLIRGNVGDQICLLENESARAWAKWNAVQQSLLTQGFTTVDQVYDFLNCSFDDAYFQQLCHEIDFFDETREMTSDERAKCDDLYTSMNYVSDMPLSKEVSWLIERLQHTVTGSADLNPVVDQQSAC